MSGPAQRESVGVVVRLLHKMRAVERVLRCCKRGECRPCDVAVIAYLASNMDNETGECIRKYKTIADGCNMGRSTVAESLKRLIVVGAIETEARHGDSGAQLATAFRFGPIPDQAAQTGATLSGSWTPSVQKPDTNCSSRPTLSFPGDQDDRKQDEDVDWDELGDWLAEAGQYVKRWGHGAESLAADDLKRWWAEKGAAAILGAIAKAREKREGKGLYGEVLTNFLENTYAPRPARRSRHAIQGAPG